MSQVLRAVKGATFQEPLSLTERDGSPTDLTGASLRWMAKARVDDADVAAVLTATSAGGTIVIVSAAAGNIRFAIPAATMDVLTPGKAYVWTLEVKAQAGSVTRYPDDFQGGPGRLLVAASAIIAVPS